MSETSDSYASAADIQLKAESWLAEVRAMVPPRPHLRLVPARCSLLVIDMLRYFAHPEGRSYLPAAAGIIPGVLLLVEAFRKTGAPVVFTRHCHRGPQDLGMLGRFFSDYIRCGEPDAEIVPELAPRRGEPVVRKTTYDAFQGTRLESMLRRRGTSQVVVSGVLTHMCCETTARSAFCHGFEVYLPVDATASSEERLHVNALLGMADSVAVAMSVREVLERFR